MLFSLSFHASCKSSEVLLSMLSPDLNFPHFSSRLLLFDSAAMLVKFGLYSMSVGQHWLDWLQHLIVSGDWEVGLGIYDHPSTVQVTTPESGFWSLGISLFSLLTWRSISLTFFMVSLTISSILLTVVKRVWLSGTLDLMS